MTRTHETFHPSGSSPDSVPSAKQILGDSHLAQRRYQEIFENSSDAIFVIAVTDGTAFQFESMNPVAMQILLQSRNNDTFVETIPAEALPKIPEAIAMRIQECRATGMPIKYESELGTSAGQPTGTYDISLIPLVSDKGIDRIFGFARDITARKQYESILHAREQEFRALAENSPDIIIRYDADGRMIYTNPAYKQLNKIPAYEEEKAIHPTQLPDFKKKIGEVLESGNAAAFDQEWQASNGTRQCYFLRAVPEHDQHGRIVSALAILRDISALKDTERRLQKTQEQLRALASRRYAEQEEERKLIAHEMHEELGQILATLRMNISMLRLSAGSGSPSPLDHMLPIVDDAINMVRNISATLRPKVLDMGIHYALEWLSEEFTLYSGIPCKLGIDEVNAVFMNDKQIRTIFSIAQESLDNVVRHAKANKVEILLERRGENYYLEVRDNGKGFDPSAPKDHSLGLIDIREQLLALGGSLSISSIANQGTLLQARIPIEEKNEEHDDSLTVG